MKKNAQITKTDLFTLIEEADAHKHFAHADQ